MGRTSSREGSASKAARPAEGGAAGCRRARPGPGAVPAEARCTADRSSDASAATEASKLAERLEARRALIVTELCAPAYAGPLAGAGGRPCPGPCRGPMQTGAPPSAGRAPERSTPPELGCTASCHCLPGPGAGGSVRASRDRGEDEQTMTRTRRSALIAAAVAAAALGGAVATGPAAAEDPPGGIAPGTAVRRRRGPGPDQAPARARHRRQAPHRLRAGADRDHVRDDQDHQGRRAGRRPQARAPDAVREAAALAPDHDRRDREAAEGRDRRPLRERRRLAGRLACRPRPPARRGSTTWSRDSCGSRAARARSSRATSRR